MNSKQLMIALIVGLLFTTACSGQEQANDPAEVKKVEITAVKKEQATQVSELSGTLQPLEEALVSFEVGGRVVELAKEEGDNVTAGELLARLDSSDYSLQVASAAAAVQQTAANLEKVNNGARDQEVTQARLQVEKATIAYRKAQDDFKRIERLYQEKAISQNEYENAKNYLAVAEKTCKTRSRRTRWSRRGRARRIGSSPGPVTTRRWFPRSSPPARWPRRTCARPSAGR